MNRRVFWFLILTFITFSLPVSGLSKEDPEWIDLGHFQVVDIHRQSSLTSKESSKCFDQKKPDPQCFLEVQVYHSQQGSLPRLYFISKKKDGFYSMFLDISKRCQRVVRNWKKRDELCGMDLFPDQKMYVFHPNLKPGDFEGMKIDQGYPVFQNEEQRKKATEHLFLGPFSSTSSLHSVFWEGEKGVAPEGIKLWDYNESSVLLFPVQARETFFLEKVPPCDESCDD